MQDASIPRPRISNAIDNVARAVGGLAIATFTAIIVYVVICRYALSFTPRWSEEIPRLLLVWVTFIGAVSAFVRNTHLCAGLTDLLVAPAGSVPSWPYSRVWHPSCSWSSSSGPDGR